MNFFFSSGDAPFFFEEQLKMLRFLPDLWRGQEGFGVSSLPLLWIDYPFRTITFILAKLGLTWFSIDKLWWISAFLLGMYGSFKLAKWFGISKTYAYLASIIYSTNTYFLMVFDGGQLGVALAYSFIPLIFVNTLEYIHTVHEKKEHFKRAMSLGIQLSILVLLDLRVAYIFLFLLTPFFFFFYRKKELFITKHALLIPIIVIAINAYWLLPTILYKNSLQSTISNTVITGTELSFFSVADFPHSLSLLHPNYPENLFGRVYFLKPEFLILPILAYSYFLMGNASSMMALLGAIGLMGIFLSKGTNEPFGVIYEFLYKYVPGFFLFRDPTKWYVIIALSYSILIPKTLEALKRINRKLVAVVFLFVWVGLLRLTLVGKVDGNLTPPTITTDYLLLKKILTEDSVQGRTLWFPTIEKYGYIDETHPGLSATSVFSETSASGILRALNNPTVEDQLKTEGISYLIVPEDVERNIFLDDYTYSESLRNSYVSALDSLSYLQKNTSFKNVEVYKLNKPTGFFMIGNDFVSGHNLNNDTWKLFIPKHNVATTLHVAMNYDPNWRLKIDEKLISPNQTAEGFMSFDIFSEKDEDAILYYLPTRAAMFGAIFSEAFLLGCLLLYFRIVRL